MSGVKVSISLFPNYGFRISDDTEIIPVETTVTDSNGKWQVALETNDNITPEGTLYKLEEFVPKVSGNTRQFMCDAETEGISEQLTLLWCQTVEVATKLPVAVYTGGYVAGGTLWRSSSIYNGQRARVFAAYSSESDARNKHAAGIPWDAWQFSGTGACPGVLGDCDLDQVDDAAAFKLTCGLTGETEQEMPFFMNWKHRAT